MAASPLLPPPSGLERFEGGDRLPRHRHDEGFVAVVISGGYLESGDAGRFAVAAGDALIHSPFEAHGDDMAAGGATVLNLPCPSGMQEGGRYRVSDPELLSTLAARDLKEAISAFAAQARPCGRALADWPDMLALRLRELAPIRLMDWAREHGLAPETVSRGFARAYGVTPHLYRFEARGRQAITAIRASQRPLAMIAADLSFSDQAHMTRTVRWLSGRTPGDWRQSRSGPRAIPEVTCPLRGGSNPENGD